MDELTEDCMECEVVLTLIPVSLMLMRRDDPVKEFDNGTLVFLCAIFQFLCDMFHYMFNEQSSLVIVWICLLQYEAQRCKEWFFLWCTTVLLFVSERNNYWYWFGKKANVSMFLDLWMCLNVSLPRWPKRLNWFWFWYTCTMERLQYFVLPTTKSNHAKRTTSSLFVRTLLVRDIHYS